MSQLDVNVIAPLGYTGPNLTGNNNFVQLIDNGGFTIFKAGVLDNVAIGKYAMLNGTTSSSSVAVGYSAGQSLTTGNTNTFVGAGSGVAIQTGFGNTCIGQNAGSGLGAGSVANTMIGTAAGDNGIGTLTGQLNVCIGFTARPSTTSVSNEITLGSSSINALRCAQTSITSLSDARDKKEIEELPVGLNFVKGLKPVKFVWDDRDEEGRHNVKDFGFIAQDLKKSQEDANLAETLKLVYEENPEKLEASYGKLIPILVKAIQELTAKVEALEAE